MYLFKNALKNLFRNKERNLLIFLVFLMMVTGSTTCSIIRSATQQKIAEAQKTLPIKVASDIDFTQFQKDSKYTEETLIDGTIRNKTISEPDMDVTVDQIKTLADSPLVDHSVCVFNASAYSASLQFVDNENALGDGIEQYQGTDKKTLYQLVEKIYAQKHEYYSSEAFKTSSLFLTLYETGHQMTADEIRELSARTVFGDTLYKQYMANQTLNDDLVNEALAIYFNWEDADGMIDYITSNYETKTTLTAYTGENIDFSRGANVLTEGKMPEKINECVIGSQFAALNNLSIGSKITLMSTEISDTHTIEMTVCGIYKEVAWDATHSVMSAPDPNNLYVTPDTIYGAELKDTWTVPTGVEFYLKNVDDVEEFQDLMRANGYNEYYNVKSNLSDREKALEPLRKISTLMKNILIAVLALGGTIFLLLTFFAVRERKYEIGVLRAIGMKKKSVINGFLYETLIIVLICCLMGMTTGTIVAQPMLNLMLNTDEASEGTSETGAPTTNDVLGAANGAESSDVTVDENGNLVDENGNIVGNISEQMMNDDEMQVTEDVTGAGIDTGTENNQEFSYSGQGEMSYMDEDGNLITAGGTQESQEELEIGDVSAYLTWNTIVLILGAALLLAALAVVIAGLYITKFEPIKILSDQE